MFGFSICYRNIFCVLSFAVISANFCSSFYNFFRNNSLEFIGNLKHSMRAACSAYMKPKVILICVFECKQVISRTVFSNPNFEPPIKRKNTETVKIFVKFHWAKIIENVRFFPLIEGVGGGIIKIEV